MHSGAMRNQSPVLPCAAHVFRLLRWVGVRECNGDRCISLMRFIQGRIFGPRLAPFSSPSGRPQL